MVNWIVKHILGERWNVDDTRKWDERSLVVWGRKWHPCDIQLVHWHRQSMRWKNHVENFYFCWVSTFLMIQMTHTFDKQSEQAGDKQMKNWIKIHRRLHSTRLMMGESNHTGRGRPELWFEGGYLQHQHLQKSFVFEKCLENFSVTYLFPRHRQQCVVRPITVSSMKNFTRSI